MKDALGSSKSQRHALDRIGPLGLLTAYVAACAVFSAGSVDAAGRDPVGRLQGQVPLADQLNGRALLGYSNGVELVGHNSIQGRLNNGNMSWLDDCAYVTAYFGSAFQKDSGLAVIDAANPYVPQLMQLWPGTPGARESQVEANADSRMVVVEPFPRATFYGDPAAPESLLQIYDAPMGNCSQLIKRGTYHFGLATHHDGVGQKIITHETRIWKDKIYATAQSPNDPGPPITVVYAGDRDHPIQIASWDFSDEPGGVPIGIHDIDITPDGKRVYANTIVNNSLEGGLVILDTSEVAAWQPGMPAPQIKRVSPFVQWSKPLPGNSHTTQYVEIKGRKYMIVANEGTGCPGPYGQIVDINYEANPIVISSLKLEVNDPANCSKTLPDHDGLTLGDSGGVDGLLMQYRYGSHYVGVDKIVGTKIVALSWYSAGLQLFDISDPYNPKHVGEFIPPARDVGTGRALPERTLSYVYFRNGNIWFSSANSGLWIIKQNASYDPSHAAMPAIFRAPNINGPR